MARRYAGGLQTALRDSIKRACEGSDDFLTDLGLAFSDSSSIYTHFGFINEEKLYIMKLKDAKSAKIVSANDFVPMPGIGKFKMEKSLARLAITLDEEGMAESILPIDEETVGRNQKIICPEFEVIGKNKAIANVIIRNQISLMPIFWAVYVSEDTCQLLGFVPFGDLTDLGYDDWMIVNDAAGECLDELHDYQVELAQQRYIVHASIADRCKDQKITIPLGFLSNKPGDPFEKPIVISFSRKIEREYGLDESTEFVMFRDSKCIYFSVKTPKFFANMMRLPLEEITNSESKITSKAIIRSMEKNLGLDKKKEALHSKRARKILLDLPHAGSRVGFSLKTQTMFTFYTGRDSKRKVLLLKQIRNILP